MSARPVCHACAIVSSADRPQVIDRRQTARGELVLRRAGGHFEVIADGTFLMDTRDGRSERELVRAVAADGRDLRLLIGGLGVGFSLDEALAGTGVGEVVVVEIEPAVVEWARTHLCGLTAHGLDDPRVRLVVDELYRHLLADTARYDGICLDVDNGPGWLVHSANAALYAEPGLALLWERLWPGGRLAVWAAAEDEDFERRLRARFDSGRDRAGAGATRAGRRHLRRPAAGSGTRLTGLLDHRLDGDCGGEGVGHVALPVCLGDQPPHPLEVAAGRHHDPRPQGDGGDADRAVMLRHDRVGVVLVGNHVDPRARRQRQEREQLAGAGGGQQQLLGIGQLRLPAEGGIGRQR